MSISAIHQKTNYPTGERNPIPMSTMTRQIQITHRLRQSRDLDSIHSRRKHLLSKSIPRRKHSVVNVRLQRLDRLIAQYARHVLGNLHFGNL